MNNVFSLEERWDGFKYLSKHPINASLNIFKCTTRAITSAVKNLVNVAILKCSSRIFQCKDIIKGTQTQRKYISRFKYKHHKIAYFYFNRGYCTFLSVMRYGPRVLMPMMNCPNKEMMLNFKAKAIVKRVQSDLGAKSSFVKYDREFYIKKRWEYGGFCFGIACAFETSFLKERAKGASTRTAALLAAAELTEGAHSQAVHRHCARNLMIIDEEGCKNAYSHMSSWSKNDHITFYTAYAALRIFEVLGHPYINMYTMISQNETEENLKESYLMLQNAITNLSEGCYHLESRQWIGDAKHSGHAMVYIKDPECSLLLDPNYALIDISGMDHSKFILKLMVENKYDGITFIKPGL